MKFKFCCLVVLFLMLGTCYAQPERIWTESDGLKPFEATHLDNAGLLKPKTVTRFFKEENGVVENFRNVALYSTSDNLIDGEYIFYDVTFSGDEHSFNLNFHFSAGKAYTSKGTYVVEGNEKLLTEYQYGTTAGTIQLSRNGKLVYKKQVEF